MTAFGYIIAFESYGFRVHLGKQINLLSREGLFIS